MSTEPLTVELQAQQALDELWSKRLIPFKLIIGKITKEPSAEPINYVIHFCDSRIPTASVPFTEGDAFRHLLQAAVLALVAKMSGPLKK